MNENIIAAGHILSTYESDLNYIRNFKRYMEGDIKDEEYLKNDSGMFYRFLISFKVARNFKQRKANVVLKKTKEWVNSKTPDDVDEFAKYLNTKSLTHKKTMVSLASKILFLNNPWEIIPMDKNGKAAISYSGKVYSDYLQCLSNEERKHSQIINSTLSELNAMLLPIEQNFKKDIAGIKTVRKNRFIDKYFWVLGKGK